MSSPALVLAERNGSNYRSLVLPSALVGKKYIVRTDVTLIAQRERFGFFRIHADALRIDVAVGHAPHSDRPQCECTNCWKELSKSPPTRKKKEIIPLFLLVDANVALGQVASLSVGPRYASKENDNGT